MKETRKLLARVAAVVAGSISLYSKISNHRFSTKCRHQSCGETKHAILKESEIENHCKPANRSFHPLLT
jgi:hypothetical protein